MSTATLTAPPPTKAYVRTDEHGVMRVGPCRAQEWRDEVNFLPF